ncbi:MAG: hypothetical protein AAF085_17840 [Planctomycetota bacterium]
MDDIIEFGDVTLHWDDFAWSGTIAQPPFPSLYGAELLVETRDEEQIAPSDQQITAWQNLCQYKPTVQLAVLQATFEYYQKMRPQYAKAGPEWIANMPELERPDQLTDRIGLNTVNLSWPYDEQPVRVGLSFGCTWEREHGIGVVLVDNKVIDIGGADCALG